MTSKEMEDRSGVPRANIRYYESEGLLHPLRAKNGYRAYSEADLETLEKIRLLRRLGVGLEDLKALQSGGRTLAEVLDTRLKELEGERSALEQVSRVCGQLRAENASYDSLDAPAYLRALDEGPASPALPGGDALPSGGAPFRRLLARVFDWYLALFAVLTAACLLGQNPAKLLNPPLTLGLLVLILVTEPLLLHLFGTTPGKALLGLRLTGADGTRLSYGEGFSRLVYLAWYGLGLWIPVWSLIQLYRSLNREIEGEPQPWDENIAYVAKPFRWRQPAALVLTGALVLGVCEMTNRFSQLPPNRGDLTVAEFAENFNRQTAYLDLGFPQVLNEQGQWEDRPSDGTVYIQLGGPDRETPFLYTVENGVVTAVTIADTRERVETTASVPIGQMAAAAAAFAWAREGAPLLGSQRTDLLRYIQDHPLEDYALTLADVTVTYEVEAEGLMDTGFFLIPETEGRGSIAYTFTMQVNS